MVSVRETLLSIDLQRPHYTAVLQRNVNLPVIKITSVVKGADGWYHGWKVNFESLGSPEMKTMANLWRDTKTNVQYIISSRKSPCSFKKQRSYYD